MSHRATTLLIAGTDTEVGKTVLTAALAAYGQRYSPDRQLGLMKPIQAGPGDRERYLDLFDLQQTPEQLNPLAFKAPLAPPLAAEREGRDVDLALAWQTLQFLQQKRDWLLVETAGGLGSPMTRELVVADLARDWHLPTVLVVPVRLGAISQTVANVALAQQFQVDLRGIVLNCPQPRSAEDIAQWTPADLIASLTGVPVLGCLPWGGDRVWDVDWLADAAANLALEALPLPLWGAKPLAMG